MKHSLVSLKPRASRGFFSLPFLCMNTSTDWIISLYSCWAKSQTPARWVITSWWLLRRKQGFILLYVSGSLPYLRFHRGSLPERILIFGEISLKNTAIWHERIPLSLVRLLIKEEKPQNQKGIIWDKVYWQEIIVGHTALGKFNDINLLMMWFIWCYNWHA